jgi:hypothetical protein
MHYSSFLFNRLYKNSFAFILIHSHSFSFIHIHSHSFTFIHIHSHSSSFILKTCLLIVYQLSFLTNNCPSLFQYHRIGPFIHFRLSTGVSLIFNCFSVL